MVERKLSYFSLMDVNVGPRWTLILLLLVHIGYVTPQTGCSCTFNTVALPNTEATIECDINVQMGEIINNVIWSRDNIPNPQSLYEVVNYDFRTMLCRTFSEELCIRNVMASDEGRYRCNFTLNNEPRFAADVCFRVLAVPEYEENMMSVNVVPEGTSVLLDTRVVYKNGGNCGDIEQTNRMELRERDCSTGTFLYGCAAALNTPCADNPLYPNVVVDVEPLVDFSSPSEYYRFRLQVKNVPVNTNTTYCAVLHIVSPSGIATMVVKRFNVMYRVILPPLVPTSVTVIENDTLVVTCDISNSNLIFVSSASWRHANGSEVDNDLILDREAVDRSFSGQYFCVVRSIEGNEATSNITTITIQYVPDVSTNVPLSLLAPVNQPLTLSCDYSAVPVPSITWSRGGTIVDQSNTHVTITSTDTHSDLLLSSITSDEGGEYTCTARNLVGSSSLSFTVTVVQDNTVNVSFVRPLSSVFEGVEDGAVEVCLNVSGQITEGRSYTVTVLGDPEVAERININGTGIQCHTIRGVVSSDDVLGDDITRGAFALSLTTNSTPVTITEPSIVIFILIEETIVLLNFTQPFYEVTESEGPGRVCVRLELPMGGAVGRPVSFRTHIRQLSNRRSRNLPRALSQPRIGYFNIGARDGDQWCLPVSVVDDEEPEPPRQLQVELFVSDVNVVPVRRIVNLTIIDDDIDVTTPTPTEPPVLEAYFTGDTPRVEGDRLYLQVEPNKPASVTCRINGTTSVPCPPGRETIISPIIPGSYSVRAIVITTNERFVVESISVVVPSGNACSAHLINRGVTVEGSSARVEFSGAGLGNGAGPTFVCKVNGGQDRPCTSPLELIDLDRGAQRVRITPLCSDRAFTVARFTVV